MTMACGIGQGMSRISRARRRHGSGKSAAASLLQTRARAYVFSSFSSNFWLIFGKLWEARSRLYRSRILQVNTRWKALNEIYKIYILLQHFAFKIQPNFVKLFRIFCKFILKKSLIFPRRLQTFQNSQILMKILRNFSNFDGETEICWILKFPEIHNENC